MTSPPIPTPPRPPGAVVQVCRDCGDERADAAEDGRCPACRAPRLVVHPALAELAIAHVDCDAFFASVEKRDRPELADRPVLIGGGRRGVVAAACYVARLYGVRSAMPMFKALDLCPDAVVLRPDIGKYAEVGRQVRALMRDVTERVEPLSIDEAFLDLSGRAAEGGTPARALALLARRIEEELAVTVSIGLGPNKLLAKLASDLDKPRGFAVIGAEEARGFLADKPVSLLWGVGAALQRRLSSDGLKLIGDLTRRSERALIARYGAIGRRLWHFAHGWDDRRVTPDHDTKSISAETTFDTDIRDAATLQARLWPLIERVARRLQTKELAGLVVVVKAKTADFHLVTRQHRLARPTRRAAVIAEAVDGLLAELADGTPYRLIGVGLGDLVPDAAADPPDLFAPPPEDASAEDASAEDAASPGPAPPATTPPIPIGARRLPLFAAARTTPNRPAERSSDDA